MLQATSDTLRVLCPWVNDLTFSSLTCKNGGDSNANRIIMEAKSMNAVNVRCY